MDRLWAPGTEIYYKSSMGQQLWTLVLGASTKTVQDRQVS